MKNPGEVREILKRTHNAIRLVTKVRHFSTEKPMDFSTENGGFHTKFDGIPAVNGGLRTRNDGFLILTRRDTAGHKDPPG